MDGILSHFGVTKKGQKVADVDPLGFIPNTAQDNAISAVIASSSRSNLLIAIYVMIGLTVVFLIALLGAGAAKASQPTMIGLGLTFGAVLCTTIGLAIYRSTIMVSLLDDVNVDIGGYNFNGNKARDALYQGFGKVVSHIF